MKQSEHEVNTCNRRQARKPRFVWRQEIADCAVKQTKALAKLLSTLN